MAEQFRFKNRQLTCNLADDTFHVSPSVDPSNTCHPIRYDERELFSNIIESILDHNQSSKGIRKPHLAQTRFSKHISTGITIALENFKTDIWPTAKLVYNR